MRGEVLVDERTLTRYVTDMSIYGTMFRYNSTITAEHGMGRLRAPYLAAEWGETIIGYMRRVKEVFDPDDLLNPDVMFSTRTLVDDLRPFQRFWDCRRPGWFRGKPLEFDKAVAFVLQFKSSYCLS
jgi:hypothetical protein